MKWYKHDSDASTDAKIRKLILRHGAEGYAVYFHCLELIVSDLEESNVTFELEHDSEIIADNLKIKGDAGISAIDKVNHILRTLIDLELFQENNNRVFCIKLAKRLDASITRNVQVKEIIKRTKKQLLVQDGTVQIQTVRARREENRIDKTRIEEIRKEKGSKAKASASKDTVTKPPKVLDLEITKISERLVGVIVDMRKGRGDMPGSGTKDGKLSGAYYAWLTNEKKYAYKVADLYSRETISNVLNFIDTDKWWSTGFNSYNQFETAKQQAQAKGVA